MFKLLSTIFGGGSRRPATRKIARGSLQVRLGLDELSHRIVPSGCSSGMAASGRMSQPSSDNESAEALTRTASFESARQVRAAEGAAGHPCGEQAQATLTAPLTNASGATGTATFSPSSGTIVVVVIGAAVDSSLDVAVDGTTIGTLNTDSTGAGKTTISAADVLAGSTITVGDLQGTFAKSQLKAELSGDTEATGRAAFDVAALQMRVFLRGAEANTTYDISVHGSVTGQLNTNESGSGKLVVTLTSAVQAGSTIAIIDATSGESLLNGAFA